MTATNPVVLDLERPAQLVTKAIIALVIIFIVVAGLIRISGAVIAQGTVVSDAGSVDVKSRAGGVIENIAVDEGDFVTAGTVVLQFDPVIPKTQLAISQQKLAALAAKLVRLRAEMTDSETLTFDYPEFPVALDVSEQQEQIEREIFDVRRTLREGRRQQLIPTLAQLESQKEGLLAQIAASEQQIAVVDETIADLEDLVAQRLAPRRDLSNELSRKSELLGQLAVLQSDLRRAEDSTLLAQQEANQGIQQDREDISQELQTVTDQAQQVALDIIRLQQQVEEVTLRAPQDGVIHQLAFSSAGTVAEPGQVIMELIPSSEDTKLEVNVPTLKITEISVGQQADVVFPSFNATTTPKLYGVVEAISPAPIVNENTGEEFFMITVILPEDQMALLTTQEVVPGMPVSIYLQTSRRSILTYLLEPVVTSFREAFRE